MDTIKAPVSSASLTIIPMPARLAAAVAALMPPLLFLMGSAGGEEVSVSAAWRPLLEAAASIRKLGVQLSGSFVQMLRVGERAKIGKHSGFGV